MSLSGRASPRATDPINRTSVAPCRAAMRMIASRFWRIVSPILVSTKGRSRLKYNPRIVVSAAQTAFRILRAIRNQIHAVIEHPIEKRKLSAVELGGFQYVVDVRPMVTLLLTALLRNSSNDTASPRANAASPLRIAAHSALVGLYVGSLALVRIVRGETGNSRVSPLFIPALRSTRTGTIKSASSLGVVVVGVFGTRSPIAAP